MWNKRFFKQLEKELNCLLYPFLCGDIFIDVAAEYQGGLGTAYSSNIGNQYALFEAIHGTASYLIAYNRGQYADPCSLICDIGVMLANVGYGATRKT